MALPKRKVSTSYVKRNAIVHIKKEHVLKWGKSKLFDYHRGYILRRFKVRLGYNRVIKRPKTYRLLRRSQTIGVMLGRRYGFLFSKLLSLSVSVPTAHLRYLNRKKKYIRNEQSKIRKFWGFFLNDQKWHAFKRFKPLLVGGITMRNGGKFGKYFFSKKRPFRKKRLRIHRGKFNVKGGYTELSGFGCFSIPSSNFFKKKKL